MSVQMDSFVGLFEKLCNLHLGEKKRSYLVQPKIERDVHFQRLKRKGFEVLFNFLKSPESKENGESTGGIRREVDAVLQNVYQMRLERRFEEADKLELMLEHLLGSATKEGLTALRLLVRLTGTGTPASKPSLGHDMYKTPVVTEETSKQIAIPSGPPCYSDSRHAVLVSSSSATLLPYMHFPQHVFRSLAPDTDDDAPVAAQAKPPSIFTLSPGCGIGGGGLFNAEREHRDQHEELTRLSLFGGLVHARHTTMGVKLDLPDLPDDPHARPPEITIPKALSMSELSEDEGFMTTEEVSSSATTPAESFVEEDIWELALASTPSQHYVWERIGCEPMPVEENYLTEAGPRTVDELCHLRRQTEHLLDPSSPLPPLRQVSSTHLVKDIVYLLIGFPSLTFPFSQPEDSFSVQPGLCTSGLCPESLCSYLGDFVACGTLYSRLSAFCRPRVLDSLYTRGLVLQGFTGAVRSTLQQYRAMVLSLSIGQPLSLLALRMHCSKAFSQIRFLAELCNCEEKTEGGAPYASFPVGVPLISYLYHETLESVHTDNYLLMLFLLRGTCQPFVLFVQDWVFSGMFRDVYGEFMIQMNHEFLEARGENYWEKGYTLTTEDEASSVPTFLAHLAPDIFRCGKALNLLRMCSPQHFLCCVSDSQIPRVFLSYARSDLRDIRVQCEMYVSRMRQIARQVNLSRAEQQQKAAAAKRELLETARRMAAMEIARLQGILDDRKRKAAATKRIELKRLKDQMTQDLQRRAGETQDAKEEDRQFMARLTQQEEARTEDEIELEKQARDELISYYSELTEEAAKRERRALWRIRRARLETARNQLLEADDRKWKAEMDDQLHAQELLQKTEDPAGLPQWATTQQDPDSAGTEPLQVGGGKQQWATPLTRTDTDQSEPQWVQRALTSQLPAHSLEDSLAAAQGQGQEENEESEDGEATEDFSATSIETLKAEKSDTVVSTSKSAGSVSSSSGTVSSDKGATSAGGLCSSSSGTALSDNGAAASAKEERENNSKTAAGSTNMKDAMTSVENVPSDVAAPEGEGGWEEKSSGERQHRMPAWAEKVLTQGEDGQVETLVVCDDQEEEEGLSASRAKVLAEIARTIPDDEDGTSNRDGGGADVVVSTEESTFNADSGVAKTVVSSEESTSQANAGGTNAVVCTEELTSRADSGVAKPVTSSGEESTSQVNVGGTNAVTTEESTSCTDFGVSKPVASSEKESTSQANVGGTNVAAPSEKGLVSGATTGQKNSSASVTGKGVRRVKSVRMVDGVSTNQETEEVLQRPHIQFSDQMNVAVESSGVEEHRSGVKRVVGKSASTETESVESQAPQVKMSQHMSATQQTQETVQRPHQKTIADRNANMESSEEIRSIPKMAASLYSVSTETTQAEWKVKKRSLFGHVSQLAQEDYTFQAPRMKRHQHQHASLESDFREFAVKPRVRMHQARSAGAETQEEAPRAFIRSYADRHVSQESERVDEERLKRQRFQQQNIFGHTADSTVQRLLYGDRFGARKGEQMEVIPEAVQLVPSFEVSSLDLMPDDLERFDDNFDKINNHPHMDLLACLPGVVTGGVGVGGGELEMSHEESEAIAFTPLSVLLEQALTDPLSAQISLVNETVVNYFLVDLKIDSHFEALHRYLFMADGDFAQNLTDILLEKFSSSRLPQEMLTPVFLNSALNRALQLSASSTQQHGDSLSFALRYMPDFFKHNAHDTLNCLELRYKVGWPINVVLTEASQASYGQVFSFMLQLKRVVWTLTDCWYKLKRDAIVKKAKDSSQFRQLQLHRHEMQHFVRVMQGYMANQIIEVTWTELQQSLNTDVHSVDDLKRVHADYLHKALFRCLLNKKAAPIMKIIQDIFSLILKFCSQLASASWGHHPHTGEITHPNFSAMVKSYKAFKEYFAFLFKVVNKLAVRGYQPHLHELLLRLNFNNFYTGK